MGPHASVDKICMTKEKFEKSSFMTDAPGMTCKQTISTNTRSTLETTVACTGTANMTMQMHIDGSIVDKHQGHHEEQHHCERQDDDLGRDHAAAGSAAACGNHEVGSTERIQDRLSGCVR